MDVTEVKAVTTYKVQDQNSQAESSSTARTAAASGGDDVKVEVHAKPHPVSDVVSGLNQVISTTNVAAKATEDIERYMRGISGIVEQVAQGDLPQNHVNILEKEANELVQAVQGATLSEAPGGIKPLAGDSYGSAWEETFGKTLDIMLPDISRDNLGLGDVRLSTSEFIVATRAAVARSQERLQDLKAMIEQASTRVQKAAAEMDVAMQNAEASGVSLREVEHALSFASTTGRSINENPTEALASLGELNSDSVGLLKG